MKKAIAYTSDIILGRTGEVISTSSQKQEIEAYAKANDIEIVGWFEDKMYNEDVMTRTGIQDLLAYEGPCDMVLVERVWSLSRRWPTLEQFYAVLDRKSLKLQSATCMWDCISQMSRRRFDAGLDAVRQPRELVTADEAAPVRMKKPARLHFAKIASKH